MKQPKWKYIVTASFIFLSNSWVSAQSLEKGFSELVKKTSPGVVNISTFVKPMNRNLRGFSRRGMPEGTPEGAPDGFPFPFWFFQDPRAQEPSMPAPKAPSKPVPFSLGTGFIIDPSGLILTNHHVIGDAEQVKVQLKEEDHDLIGAEIIGRDPELDVALLKIKTHEKLIALPLGDSEQIGVGEFVLAIGNPMGYGHSVSHGILSAKNRKSPEFQLGRYLQTDASINPGNSGGPLLNMKGEVVGINNAIDARAQGIGFAIPINLVKAILPQLKTTGTVARGYIGVSVGEITDEIAEKFNVKPSSGTIVVEVQKGLPADRAGVQPYDVIISANQVPIRSPSDLTEQVTSVPAGKNLELKILRKGKEKILQVQVGTRPVAGRNHNPSPSVPSAPKASPSADSLKGLENFGFSVDQLDENLARSFGIPSREGTKTHPLVVIEIQYGKSAADSSLARGDLVLDVGGVSVSTPQALSQELLKQSKTSSSVLLRVRRYNGQNSQVLLIALKKS